MKMKRILALLLVAALAATPLSAMAEAVQPVPVRGDINGDGKITAADAVRILLYTVGMLELTEEQQAAADISGGGVAADDATRILLHVVDKKLFATSVDVFGGREVVQMPVDRAFVIEKPEDIYNYFSPEGESDFAQGHANRYALVKLTVTGDAVNFYSEDTPALTSHTRVPVRIDKICFTGEAMELTVGQELTVQDSYYVDPATDTLFSLLETTPLVPGYVFYVVLFRHRENHYYSNEYLSVCSYPVMRYETFSGFEQVANLQNEEIRTALIERYELGVMSDEPQAD